MNLSQLTATIKNYFDSMSDEELEQYQNDLKKRLLQYDEKFKKEPITEEFLNRSYFTL